jgi:hemolysin activation/secretion protein
MRFTFLLLLLASFAYAQEELKTKGFFIGVDYEKLKMDSRYKSTLYNYANEGSYSEPAFKLGYQYYFTRIYLKYSNVEESYPEYTVDSTSYEADFEYIPVLYRDDSFALRLIAGVSMGYSDNELKNLNSTLDAYHTSLGLTNFNQKQAIYGVQMGLMLEMSMGLSGELGYRYRRGNVMEFEDDSGDITVMTKRRQLYVGLNYLF